LEFTLAAENKADEWLIELLLMSYEYTEVKINFHNCTHTLKKLGAAAATLTVLIRAQLLKCCL
jgi:hypothetical protein